MKPYYVGLVASLASQVAYAQQAPDLRGEWNGRSDAIIRGKTAEHYADLNRAEIEPRLAHADLKITIINQEGRLFWGYIEGGGTKENLIGSFAMDLNSLYLVDSDGYSDGKMSTKSSLDLCYRHINSASAIVSCVTFNKQ